MARVTAENVGLFIPTFGECNKSIRASLVNKMRSKSKIEMNGVRVFENLNFQLNDGDRVGLFGVNGSGKTSLLRLIAGIYPPSSGCLEVSGTVKSLISLSSGLDPNLSGHENIKRLCLMNSTRNIVDKKMFDSVADFSELGDFLHMPVRTYSAGMQLRLLSGAIFTDSADIFLVDEYFGVGDRDFSDKVRKRMETLVSETNIFVLATHSKELIQKYCNRVFMVNNLGIVEIQKSEM